MIVAFASASSSWASSEVVDRAKLPTAPRAAFEENVDLSQLPKNPPYTLFLGNLSYDVFEEDVERFFNNKV